MSRSASLNTGFAGKTQITFEAEQSVATQLDQLSTIVDKPVGELVNLLIAPLLNQIVADGDTDLMRMVL